MADKKEILDSIKGIQAQNEALKSQRDLAISINDLATARGKNEEINLNKLLLVSQQERLISELKGKNNKLTTDEKKLLDNIFGVEKNISNELTKQQKIRNGLVGSLNEVNRQLKIGFQYLMQSDKAIKSTILSLGLSGAKAEMMRASFEQSAGFVARLGGSLEDIQTIMIGYADETGRARALTSEMVKDITLIGKGTGLGIEQATKLGAQFESMGVDTKTLVDYVQGVVETSERMGVNTTKVLKNVNDNFKKLNTYTFQQGTKGFAQMAMYSEKFRINMDEALNSAKVAKSLEGAIDLAAQLQVMGGEFAKTDPFEMLFLSRNDPAKFTEKIADMTKGVVSFRKMADGTFQHFISPADQDRLAAVNKSLGLQEGSLTQIAQKQADIQRMRQQMNGAGLSRKDRDLVEGMATINAKTGRFAVQIAGASKDISIITSNDLKVLQNQKATLEQRAKDSQTFEDAFKNTIAQLKTALLPILKTINSAMEAVKPIAAPIIKFLTNNQIAPAWAKVGLTFMTAGLVWKGVSFKLDEWTKRFLSAKGKGGGIGNIIGDVDRNGKPLNVGAQKAYDVGQVNRSNAAANASRAGGIKNLMTGAGVGAAAVGIGGGVALAAVGISKLADSMSKLTDKQADTLKSIAMTLAITFPVAAIGIALVAGAATAGAVGLLALGAAITLVGAGVGLAAAGIGAMGLGLSKMIDSSKNAGTSLSTVAGGIAQIGLAMAGTGIGSLLGGGGMALGLKAIASQAPAIAEIGESFKQINAVMSGSKEDFMAIQNAVDSISKMNVKGGTAFADLANLLKTPLKVEFADKDVAVVSNITMNIDGYKFHEATNTTGRVIQKTQEVKRGQGSLGTRT